ALAVGWAQFLRRVLPRITWDRNAVVVAVGTFALLTFGVHWLGRALLRGRRSERRWRFGWSLTVTAAVIVVFAAGICMIGVTHQSGWLLTTNDPVIVAHEQPRWSLHSSQTSLKVIAYGVMNYQDAYTERPNERQGAT